MKRPIVIQPDFQKLVDAALDLYYAGRWSLPVKRCAGSSEVDQAKLWENLRDALGLPPGTTSQ